MRIGLAFSCFFRILLGKKLPPDAAPLLLDGALPVAPVVPVAIPTAAAAAAATHSNDNRDALMRDGALGLLGLLQEEGRLIDFLREDLGGFSDADIGAAARAVHAGCKRVVDDYLVLEPIIPGQEDSQVTLPAGFSPQEVRTSGIAPDSTGRPTSANVARGILRHHGWRATTVKFPQWLEGVDRTVIAPAQVDLN